MLIVLVWAGVSGCTPNDYLATNPPHETEEEMHKQITKDMETLDKEKAMEDNPQPADFVGIAEVLGCMFAPDECVLEKRKQEKKMDR